MQPEIVHSVGEQRRSCDGKSLEGVYDETYLCFRIDTRVGEELPHAIERTLDRLRRSTFLDDFRSSGGALGFFVSIFVEGNKGVTLDADLLRELAEMGIDLGLDIYGS